MHHLSKVIERHLYCQVLVFDMNFGTTVISTSVASAFLPSLVHAASFTHFTLTQYTLLSAQIPLKFSLRPRIIEIQN